MGFSGKEFKAGWGLRVGVEGFGCRVQRLGYEVCNLGSGFGFRVLRFRFGAWGSKLGFGVQGLKFRVWGLGLRVEG